MRPLPSLFALLACGACSGPRGPDLVLVTWDTVRADHVGGGGQGPSPTPTWDRLAVEGVVFDEVRTPCPLTLPAHATLLTGQEPPRHGARLNGTYRVADDVPLLQERLQHAGYATGAVVSASVLRGRYGLARGFDVYDEQLDGAMGGRDGIQRRADAATRAALRWVETVPRRKPLFLWLHLYDPHKPWEAPEPWASAHTHPYDAEIAFADHWTGRLLEGLAAEGRLEQAVVVITSDHGEGLGEHGEETHGYLAYETTIRVPLLFWSAPLRWPAGSRVTGPASLADVAPTLAGLAGVSLGETAGVDLGAGLGRGSLPPRSLAIETVAAAAHFGAAPVFGVVDEASTAWIDLPRRERYDLPVDPHQLQDRYDPGEAPAADALFAAHPRHWPDDRTLLQLDATTEEQLAALGYLAPAPPEDPAPAALDPKDLVACFDLPAPDLAALADQPPRVRLDYCDLRYGRRRGEPPRERATALRRLLEESGRPSPVVTALVEVLDELALPDEALAVLAASGDPTLVAQADQRRARLAELQQLEVSIRAALSARPDDPVARYDLALTLHRLGRHEEAAAGYQAVLARGSDLEAAAQLARLHAAAGRYQEAARVLAFYRGVDPGAAALAAQLEAWAGR